MKRSTTTMWTILAVIALVTLGGSHTAHALGTRTIQFGAPVDNSGNILLDDTAADLLAASNASAVRLNLKNPWGTDTAAFYSTYDTIVDRLRSRGLEVIGLMSNEFLAGTQTDWQQNAAETTANGDGHNAYIDQFGYQAARVAQHFEGRIHYWEIWNEPNCYGTYPTGCTFIYPSNFAALLAHVWTQMRYYNSFNVEIISGGLLGHDIGGKSIGSSGATYLSDTYAKGIDTATGDWAWIKQNAGQYPLDQVGQHIYLDPGSTVAASSIQQYLDWVRNAYVGYEGGSTPKKTFVTELGWRSDAVGESVQASNLTTAYSVTESNSYVATTAWFFLRDEPAWPEPWGLLRTDSSAKPAWAAFGGGCIGCGGGGTQIPLVNAGIESNSSGQYGSITGWGPSGGWAYHSGFPKGNNGGLGASFGFYSAGTTETVGQLLTDRFQAGTSYTFKSYAIGGGNNTGTIPYQIGYASTDGIPSSFVALATNPIPLDGNTSWVLTPGVTYTTGSSGPEIGKQIIVRLGDGSAGGSNDIWFDNLQLTRSTSGPIAHSLVNPGIETNSSAQYGSITGWGLSGGWAYHSSYPKGNNGGLGASFGFYSAGTTETVGQLLTDRFQAGTTYTFRSWAIGGGNNTGTVPYQIGYASTDGNLGSFVPLATNPIPLNGNTAWVLTQGVTYATGASGAEIGKQIIVRLGGGSAGGSNDIWFDDFELTSQ